MRNGRFFWRGAVFSWLLTSEQIPQSMAEWMTMEGFGTVAFLLVVNVVLLAGRQFHGPPPPSC